MADDDLFDYDYEAGGDDAEPVEYYPPPGPADESGPVRAEYGAIDEFYGAGSDADAKGGDSEYPVGGGIVGAISSSGPAPTVGSGSGEGRKFNGLCGDRTLNCGCTKVKVKDIPLPLLDPDWFDKVRTSHRPWQLLLTIIEFYCSFFVVFFNLITYIFALVLFSKFHYISSWDIINLLLSMINFLAIPWLILFGKYLPLFKILTASGDVKTSLMIVYGFFVVVGEVFYVFMIGGMGSVGIYHFFMLVAHMKVPAVAFFGVFAALLIICFVLMFVSNLAIVLFYLCIRNRKRAAAANGVGERIDDTPGPDEI